MNQNISFEQWLEERDQIETRLKEAIEKLKQWDDCRNEMGLLPDSIRQTPIYRRRKKEFNILFLKLQEYNRNSPKGYMKKASQLRLQKWVDNLSQTATIIADYRENQLEGEENEWQWRKQVDLFLCS